MQLSKDDIETLINGLYLVKKKENHDRSAKIEKGLLHPVEMFINDLIALNFCIENKEIEKNLTSNNVFFSPLQKGLALNKNKNTDFLKEYLHLCRTYKTPLHPIIAYYLFQKTSKAHEKAVILNHCCAETSDKMIQLGWIHPSVFKNHGGELNEVEDLLLQMFLNIESKEYRESIYQKLYQLEDIKSKRAFLENLSQKQKFLMPASNESLYRSASKKWNRQFLELQLSIDNSPAQIAAVEQISLWIDSNNSENKWTKWSHEGMSSCGINSEEEWIFFLISYTDISILFDTFTDFGLEIFSVNFTPAWLQNALYFQNSAIIKNISEKMDAKALIKELEKVNSAIHHIDLSWEFIKTTISSLHFSSESLKWKVYSLLMKHYRAFIPDSFTIELIIKIKDSDSKTLMSEDGVKLMSFLTGKLSLQANPLHLSKLENYKNDILYDPLEKDLDKLIASWKFRLEMRKDFEREKKRYTRDEKK
ncbi:MAG: hypothetical protein EA362_04635 [Saprospirales bacterium]|nr:MAG: hypothetical protein EA362_04635 [Saprospirales bacterium]